MTYPDGEVVTYGYDEAGQLNKMSSEKDGFTYDFIKDMTYDVYGNISSKTYGNGTTTNYTYDPKRQHLTQMTAANKDGLFINATYSYDKIDNILGITNTAKPNSTIGGNYHHSYTYDDFSRLVSAEGGCKDNNVTYNLTMTYDAMSNPLCKIQKISGSEVATSHDLTYLYNGEKPDAASQIGEDRYTYDDNGNPTLIMSDSTTRTITWDEENRMVMLNDDGYVSRYTYDFSGTRVIKSHGPQESVYINGAEQGLDYHDADNYTLYVSPYLIVSNERFTKHYYAGTQRIASKVGSGDFYNVYGVNGFHLTAGDKDYKERLEQIEEGVKEYYNANGIPPGEPTMKGSNADPYVADVALPNAELGDYSVPTNWPTNVKFNEPGDVPGPVVQFEDEDQGDVKAGYGFESDNLYEGDWFFFHTDHLGSASYLTDTAGNVSQFVCYTPYGEAIVDEHLTTYENPFKFSGKELDDITGLYVHGARSRNPLSTLWYGVDPLFEKYPEMSPYGYCHGNPVLLIDLDGCEDENSRASVNSQQQTHETEATFKAELSFGIQFGANIGNFGSAEFNVISVELCSYNQVDKGSDSNSTSEFNYIGKDGVKVMQNASIGVGVPLVGNVSAEAGQSFIVHQGGYTQSESEMPSFNADIDVAKFTYNFKFIIGVDIEINYDFSDKNTFVAIFEYLFNITETEK